MLEGLVALLPLLELAPDHLLQLGEVSLEAGLDVLDRLQPVARLSLNIRLHRQRPLLYHLAQLLLNLKALLLRQLEALGNLLLTGRQLLPLGA